MCIIGSLFPATLFAIVGFFILFASSKSEGGLRTFGIILSIWIFIVALMFPLGGTYMVISGNCPMADMMQNMPNTEMPFQK